jgi:hypothetical protein
VRLTEAGILSSSSATISLLYLLSLEEAKASGIQLNKTQLLALIPEQLGSLTRKRSALERLISINALGIKIGKKKSERVVFLTDWSKELLAVADS